ncbi:MAG: lysostaphin resistance A-like protein [Planctomycetota bacterium]|jgi:membrane protease YdiL (CAAX protease family)
MTTANASPPRKTGLFVASIWLAVIGALVLLRYRGRIGLFRSFHEWLAESGVADWVRNSDNELLFVVFGVGLWAWMKRGSGGRSAGLLGDLGLGGPVARGCIVGLVIGLPYLLLGAVTGGAIAFEWPMVRVYATGPFAEEWFFRGVLVLAFVRLAGVSFWPTAIVSGALFGAVHVQWTADGFAQGWPHGLVTTAGGIWYAWLAREWGRNLWVVIVAHALMNLASPWYGTGNAAWHEIGRGATIALGTIMTIRPAWLGMSWARRAQGP